MSFDAIYDHALCDYLKKKGQPVGLKEASRKVTLRSGVFGLCGFGFHHVTSPADLRFFPRVMPWITSIAMDANGGTQWKNSPKDIASEAFNFLSEFSSSQPGAYFRVWPSGKVSLEIEKINFFDLARCIVGGYAHEKS